MAGTRFWRVLNAVIVIHKPTYTQRLELMLQSFFFFLMFFFIWLHQVLVSVPGLFVVVMCLSLVVAWTPECPGLVAPQHVGS